MGIRAAISKRPSLTITAALLMIAAGAVAIFVQARDTGGDAGDVFFSTDDGQTFFPGDARRFAPYLVDGKEANRAHVFECGGKRVVGYLSRYTPEAHKAFADAKAARAEGRTPDNVGQLATIGVTGVEVKLPGANNKWVRQGDIAKATKIRSFKCPDGNAPQEVYP